MSRVFLNSSLKRCNQRRPISFKWLDVDMWNSDRVLITSSALKQWAKWEAICSCFAWNCFAWKCCAFITWSSVVRKTTLFWNVSASIQATSIRQCWAQGKVWSGAQEAILETVIIFNRCVKCAWCHVKVPDTFQLKFKQKTNTQVIILHSDSELLIVLPLGRMFSNYLSAINLKIFCLHILKQIYLTNFF